MNRTPLKKPEWKWARKKEINHLLYSPNAGSAFTRLRIAQGQDVPTQITVRQDIPINEIHQMVAIMDDYNLILPYSNVTFF